MSFQKIIKLRNPKKILNYQKNLFNIFLNFFISGITLIYLIEIIRLMLKSSNYKLAIVCSGLIFAFLLFLFWLFKKGKTKTIAWFFIITYTSPLIFLFIQEKINLPIILLSIIIIIINLLALLIKNKTILITSEIISIFILAISYLRYINFTKLNNYLFNNPNKTINEMACILLVLIITIIVLIFSYSLKQLLLNIQKDEKKLKEKYSLLEIKEKNKIKHFYQIKQEKIIQLFNSANYGRLSAGIFHDLINLLTAISLNLEESRKKNNSQISNNKIYINQALSATHHMEVMLFYLKKQIKQESTLGFFTINEEIKQITNILSKIAQRVKIKINFIFKEEIKFYGDSVEFSQIIINLLFNAIEASKEQLASKNNKAREKEIEIKLIKQKNEVIIIVSDSGIGIYPENLNKIFEPFFSTKKKEKRCIGLGLNSVKNIVEKSFLGKIDVKSKRNKGSKFIISLPFNFYQKQV
jgi:signal transduction histidine kinase